MHSRLSVTLSKAQPKGVGASFMLSPHRPRLRRIKNMPKATCVQNVTFGATGDVYVSGEEYDVPAATLKKYPDYFKQASTPKTKKADTEENK